MTGKATSRDMRGTLTVPDALERSCRWFAGRTALVEGDRALTYEQLGGSLRKAAAGYASMGVGKGDRVAYLCAGSLDHALAYYASHRLGAITVNLHLRETASHQVALFERLEPRLLVYDADKSEVAAEVARRFPAVRRLCVGGGGLDDPQFSDLLDGPDDHEATEVGERDPAIIQLSSGSTGVPKALVHTHASVLESWTGGLYMWSGISPEDCFLNAFSPSFVVWLVHPGSFLVHGASVVLMRRWDPAAFVEAARARRVTCSALTPTQWRAVMASAPDREALASLRMAAYLGEKMAPERLKEATERICPSFCSFYGMSECLGIGGCVIRSSDFLGHGKWGSVGRPTINSDLRIIEPGSPVAAGKPAGELGEIAVRAASFAAFNWGDPGWKARVLTEDGWYRTGDLGYVDADGFVFLRGRVDNQIATGGIKVAAEEIEQALSAHPDVAAAGVIGVEDEQWGQRIVAFIVPQGGAALDADGLDSWCRAGDRLAGFKRPREWRFVESLPLTSVGKLDRKALQRDFAGMTKVA